MAHDQKEVLDLLDSLPEEQRRIAVARLRQFIEEIEPSRRTLRPGARAFVERVRQRRSKEERRAAVRRMAGSYLGPPIDDSRDGLYPDSDER
jgi:hypothetical protein